MGVDPINVSTEQRGSTLSSASKSGVAGLQNASSKGWYAQGWLMEEEGVVDVVARGTTTICTRSADVKSSRSGSEASGLRKAVGRNRSLDD